MSTPTPVIAAHLGDPFTKKKNHYLFSIRIIAYASQRTISGFHVCFFSGPLFFVLKVC